MYKFKNVVGEYSKSIGCETEHVLVKLLLWRFLSVDTAIRRDFTVGFQNRRAVVETLWHYKLGPNDVFETLGPYLAHRQREATRGPWKPRDGRPQRPVPAHRFFNAARIPKATPVWGTMKFL